MAKTILNVKTDTEVKERAREIASGLGLPLSAVVNAYLKDFIRTQAVTFSLEPRLKPEIIALLEEADRDFRKSKNVFGPFNDAKKALGYLHK